jgi:hypothetical protein
MGTATIESDGRVWWVAGHEILACGRPAGSAQAKPNRSEKRRLGGGRESVLGRLT